MNAFRNIFLAVSVIMVMFFCGCANNHKLYRSEKTRELMGTFITVTACHEKKSVADAAVKVAFDEIDRINSVMSTYIRESEISLFNRSGGKEFEVSGELFFLIDQSVKYSEISGGAFDITVGPLVDEWLKARDEERAPDPGVMEAARERVGYRKLILDNEAKTVRFSVPGMEVNLGAIAKGYAADRAVAVMAASGVINSLVNAGGDIASSGTRQDGTAWTIGLKDPSGGKDNVLKLKVSDLAVTTSGNYEQFIESGGKKYSHIFDPRTGESSGCVSATVISVSAMESDALSTTICVLGPEDGIKLVEKLPGVEAFIIDAEGNTYRSSGFDSYVVKD